MTKQDYDLADSIKKTLTKRYEKYYKNAKAAQEAGKLKLVSETICQPHSGYAFKVDKGQTIRYENIDGIQILDTIYHVRSRPTEEWACSYHSTLFGSITPYEGMHYFSNTPGCRPLMTIIKDTVDLEKIKADLGETASHNFIYNSGRCTSGAWEAAVGLVNCNSCDLNLKHGLVQALGEEDARKINTPAAFMHFQCVAFDVLPMNLSYYPSRGRIKTSDYVELLAHDDVWAIISPCPIGDQNDTSSFEDMVCWPFKVAIYEGADAPLETAPDPQQKTTEPIDFIMAGRPGMVKSKVGGSE